MTEIHHPDLNIPEGTVLADTLLNIFKYNKLKKLYSEHHDKDPVFLIDTLFGILGLTFDISPDDLANIPSEGPFITVSNHPYRGIDSMILYKILSEKRKDYRILGSYLLHQIEPLKEAVLPVNTDETERNARLSYSGIKNAIKHLEEGHCLGIFPAGEAARSIESTRVVLDNIWRPAALKLIRNSKVPVIPVYFHATNSRIVRFIGKIHPVLTPARLPLELTSSSRREVKVRIGTPIPVKELLEMKGLTLFGHYLRARVYSLGMALDAPRFSERRAKRKLSRAEALAAPTPANLLREEFIRVRQGYELFCTHNYSVICAPAGEIPLIFNEIGRLRELTFRKVGEGTNKRTDIDHYDFYFNHLFIWDTGENRIAGAYRIGMGSEIMSNYGIRGFYIHSLFKMKESFGPVLSSSLELGRSFITEEYQKKAIPLFLLWKGIMVFILKNPGYRYLIGPVSISNDFSKFSKSLIVGFIRKYFADDQYASLVEPRRNFVVKAGKVTDPDVFIDTSERDINKIEKIITNIEPGYRIPVLLKKYLEINGKIIAFNIDPKFNYCLDGLLILDLYATPREFIKGLSRELNDDSILDRFTGK